MNIKPMNEEEKILELINQYSALIKYIILRNLHKSDDIDPEDIEQEVKIKIWKSLLRGKKVDKLSSYISKIAYSITIDELRKMRKHSPPKETDGLKNVYNLYHHFHHSNNSSPESALLDKEAKVFINQAIDSLSPNRKQVLRLYNEGFSIDEICEFFKWDKVKVRHLLYRGIDDLKKKYGNSPGTDPSQIKDNDKKQTGKVENNE